jgi:hypothetical protein
VYLFLAYRAIAGNPLSANELVSLQIDGWHVGLLSHPAEFDDESDGVAQWHTARQALDSSTPMLGVTRTTANYESYLNCPQNAIATAARTLQQRLAQGGDKWARIWLAGQDQVFANCSPNVGDQTAAEVKKPDDLPADAPAWLVKDHAYQLAAALFYAEKYDQARDAFLAIGQDRQSPWQMLGKYLAARCLLRKATLTDIPGADSSKMLDQAREELVSQVAAYPPAQDLVDWVDMHIHLSDRQVRLEQALAQATLGPRLPLMLGDYIVAMDKLKPKDMMASTSSLTKWIGAMGGYDDQFSAQDREAAMSLARDHLGDKPNALWLMPLLAQAQGGELHPNELSAAAAVPASSPAYQTLQYHLARLAIEEGHSELAAPIVSHMLAGAAGPMSTATRNRWLALKLITAGTPEAFYVAAPRQTADGKPVPQTYTDTPSPPPRTATADHIDDFTARLMRYTPMTEMAAAVKRLDFPPSLRTQTEEVIWTRAVLFGNYKLAESVQSDVVAANQSSSVLFQRFLDARDDKEKQQAAVLVLATAPELEPELYDKFGAQLWWGCGENPRPEWTTRAERLASHPPAFLSKDDLDAAFAEADRIVKLPGRIAYLAPAVMSWAKSHPDDEEAAHALHRLVRSTHYSNGCAYMGDPNEGRDVSTQAFELLHKLFPDSPWTKATPYHY